MSQSTGSRSGDVGKVLLFGVGQQLYALALAQVREVLPLATLIRLPEMPHSLAGMLRLRGVLLPVVDLGRRLGLPDRSRDVNQRIVVALIDGSPIGLLVDSVCGVLAVGMTAEAGIRPVACRLVRGTFETAEGLVTLLEAAAVADADTRDFLPMGLTATASETHRSPQHVPRAGGSGAGIAADTITG